MLRLYRIAALVCASALALPAAPGKSLFAIYAANREENRANYITGDFLLLGYSMVLENAVTKMEETQAAPDFQKFIAAAKAKLANAAGEDGQANRAYIEILDALLEGRSRTGIAEADQEIERIGAAAGPARSALFRQTIDYSQFKPRGKYSATPGLSHYFQAMRYAGAVLFSVKESAATGVTAADADRLTARASAFAQLIEGNAALKSGYAGLLDRFTWLFGPSEDLTAADVLEAGADRSKLLDLARKTGRQPKILGGVIDTGKLESGITAADALTGWRLFPSRYTPDSAAFQYLVYDSVTKYRGARQPFTLAVVNGRKVKGFPRGLELMSLLGSQTARQRLEAAGDLEYVGYEAAAAKARAALTSGEGLAGAQFKLLSQWLAQPGDEARRLNSALAFWTLYRHQNLLYAKQSYTASAKGLSGDARKEAWIEPLPELYRALVKLADETNQHLNFPGLATYAKLLGQCADIAAAEKEGKAPAAEQANFLNDLDQALLDLTGRSDAPAVVDVHTEPNSRQVVEEATAWGKPVVHRLTSGADARGALLTYQEFKQPMDRRLTDEEWRRRLAEAPKK
jgi:hypothetical protein